MAYAIAYCIHTLEMSALRGWGVAFLGFVAVATGASGALLSPTIDADVLGLWDAGQRPRQRGGHPLGPPPADRAAMIGSAVCAVLLGFVGPHRIRSRWLLI